MQATRLRTKLVEGTKKDRDEPCLVLAALRHAPADLLPTESHSHSQAFSGQPDPRASARPAWGLWGCYSVCASLSRVCVS